MKKKDLLKRIELLETALEQLSARVLDLEGNGYIVHHTPLLGRSEIPSCPESYPCEVASDYHGL